MSPASRAACRSMARRHALPLPHPPLKDLIMRKPILAAALLLATALPAAAQSTQVTTNWSGANLVVTGGTLSGCNIRVLEASHTGSTASAIRITFVNNGTRSARVNGSTTLSGNGQSKTGAFRSVAMAPGIGAVSQGMVPFAGVLAGTTLTVNITSCQQQ